MAIQSARGRRAWLLEFEPRGCRVVEPLMGWTATDDRTAQLRLKFSSLSAAVDYAEREGLDFDVIEPPARRPIRKSYRRRSQAPALVARQSGRRGSSMSGDRFRPTQAHELEVNHGIRISHPGREKSQVPAQRDDFFDPFVSFRREMDRIVDDFFNARGLRPMTGGWQGVTPTVKDEQVDAKYDKGVLTVRVPKPAEVQQAVRRIEVKAT